MSVRHSWLIGLLVAGCSAGPFSCPNDPAGPLPTLDEVCSHIDSIGCIIEQDPLLADVGLEASCSAGYADVQSAVPTDEFGRIVRCYMQATECSDLESCNQACGPDGGPITYLPGVDGGDRDAGSDASTDAGGDDAGLDAGRDDAGTDAGGTDAGFDAGTDAGSDAGTDAGFDAGSDAGSDAGFDAGTDAGSDAGMDAG